MSDHYVVLGLARVRAPWFGDLGRWATSAALPIEFVRCVSAEEVRARLGSGRGFSALFVDVALPALDRDLTDVARAAGCAVVAVTDGVKAGDWRDLGVDVVLTEPVTRDMTLNVLREHAPALSTFTDRVDAGERPAFAAWRGTLVAVLGGGGVGSSTVAMAVAQGLAGDPRRAGLVALIDLARQADLALLHDAGDVVPGIHDLVDAHRTRTLAPDDVRDLAFHCPERGYDLYLGLRRPRDWSALRPRAFEAALESVLRSHGLVVADVDDDLEGEAECGSIDVEERNVMARTAVRHAHVVLAVGSGGVAGVHRLAHVLHDLTRFGVAADRILPIVNRAPRGPASRAEITRALARSVERLSGEPVRVASPLHLPERRRLDEVHRDASRLPRGLVDPLARATAALLDGVPVDASVLPDAVRVRPGSLGTWRG